MRGRPKSDNSRNNQYRVRLNDEENRKLDYASKVTGRPKSEILRIAFVDYYNKVLLNELKSSDSYDIDRITLWRVIQCPHCGSSLAFDLREESSVSSSELQMGPEILYEFDFQPSACPDCGGSFRIKGHISEYPAGALNHEEIIVEPITKEV